MASDQFSKAENEYFRLKGLLSAGRITKAQFEQSLRQLAIQDALGRQWILGVDDGKWYAHDGRSWVAADPHAGTAPLAFQAVPGSMPRAPAQSNWIKFVAFTLGGVLLLCLGIGVGLLVASNAGIVRLNPSVNTAPTFAPIPSPLVLVIATPVPFPTAITLPTATPLPTSTVTPTPTTSPTPTITPRPEGNCADPNARWENVTDGQTIEPLQAFIGTATSQNFAGYVVEWLRPGNVLHRSVTPVVHGQLFVWNTLTVGNGEYAVALIVFLNDGSTLAPCVIRVQIAH